MSIIYTGNATWESYLNAIQQNIIYPRFICYLLNYDCTHSLDITSYMTQGNSSITISFQNGIRRTCQIEFYNDLTGVLLANPNNNIWTDTKFKIYCGLSIDGSNDNCVYFPCGVYVLKEPQFTSNFSTQTILFDGVDLFSMFDDTISGTLDSNFILDSSMTFLTATQSILNLIGDPLYPLISNTYINSQITAYIKRNIGDKISDVCGDLFKTQNYYYNNDGQFVVEDGQYDIDDSTKGSLYDFGLRNDQLYLGSIKQYLFDNVKNKVIVEGNNLSSSSDNSASASILGEATNDNPLSPFCVNRIANNPNNPKPRTVYIQDNNITDTVTANYKAAYELKQRLLNYGKYTLYTGYIPHINEVNQVVTVTDDRIGFNKERMLITNIQIPISTDSKFTITATPTNELAFNV